MSTLAKVINGLNAYRDVAFDLLRVYLGIGLFVRGVLFLFMPATYLALIPESVPPVFASTPMLYAVALVHLGGGAFMAIGLKTRLAALVQIPVLLGAVVLSFGGLFSANQSFEFASLVLFLLVLVFVYGSGPLSVDRYTQRTGETPDAGLDRLSAYREQVIDVLRVYLGIGLFVRGVLFFSNTDAFMDLLQPTAAPWLTSVALIHYVALAHLVGGAMLAAGLLTRVAALAQIPILLGAVFVVHFQGGLLASSQSLEFSVLVLVLLVAFFLYGSGRWSADYYLFVRDTEEPGPAERSARAREILEQGMERERPIATSDLSDGVLVAEPAVGRVVREDPLVVAEARYSALGWLLFLIDVTPRPREIVFRHINTGEIVDRSRDPDVIEAYRYR